MTRGSIQEYTEAVRERYLLALRKEKGKILDEFTKVTGRHRKAAIRLLRHGNQPKTSKKRGRPRRYDTAVAKAVCQWLKESGYSSLFIKPGSPWENDCIESFFNKLRDECLNREIFQNGKEAQTIAENWRQEYNNYNYRPHSSLGYLTPPEFARQYYENNHVEAKPAREKTGIVSL